MLVLGDLVPEEEATREAFQADGTRHTLDLAACILNLEPASDWLLRMDDERCYLTDAVLGESWGTDATLLKAREGWDGSEYPTIENGRRPSPHMAAPRAWGAL